MTNIDRLAAILAGLIVEPSFKSISGRFNEFGVSMESYVCSAEIYRKLVPSLRLV